ncbi:right-handed parallel beta-helix repeat-containing protein [Halosimplex aquaticum]|uniref:Right-handed parallel beta-helix repeat-containing protein n=1 Tax=Halosimplex aquaticum TaxID=3026162 RepID=A0ABD5XTF9_9EURY|nr:right-handed parallel beta-helix repeat-containing protein [Halosimplex aquaticum]
MALSNQDGTADDGSQTKHTRAQAERTGDRRGRTGGFGRRSFLGVAASAAAVPLLGGAAQAAPDARRVEIVSTGPEPTSYEFTVTGKIDLVKGTTERNDAVTENDDGSWTAAGQVVDGGRDAYTVAGEITDFSPEKGAFELRVDGSAVDPAAVGGESSGSSDSATEGGETAGTADLESPELLGGGDGYPNAVAESEADVVAATLDELEQALNGASSGDVVYVAGDATIDATPATGTERLTIPSGVTLASDRGIDGASGGEIKTDVIDWETLLWAESDARVTGVRITGPLSEYIEYSKPVSSGLTVKGSGVEIDNVEASGFSHSAIKLNASAHVHHSYVHTNSMDGLGYGIMCYGGQDTLVEYNRFDFNRHSVANEGTAGYEVRYNRFEGKAIAYQVGTHRPGATTLKIHHNTFIPTKHINDGVDPSCHVTIRGVPDDVADIHHNWFHNPKKPLDSPDMWTNEAIVQAHVDEWSNVEYSDNHYGPDEPSADIGCPR